MLKKTVCFMLSTMLLFSSSVFGSDLTIDSPITDEITNSKTNEYKFSKEEMDELGLREDISLLKSNEVVDFGVAEGINEGFTTLSPEQEAASDAKMEEAIVKNSKLTRAYPSTKVVKVGTAAQIYDYYCGPASAYNLIYGYDVGNYGYYCTKDGSSLATQHTFAHWTNLNTSSAGTNFDYAIWQNTLNKYAPGNSYELRWGNGTAAAWKEQVESGIKFTINKNNGYERTNYSVVANLNHGAVSSAGTVHTAYLGGIQHYIVVYGYDSNGARMYISDSNSALSSRTYVCTSSGLAAGIKARGMIF